MNGRIGHLHNHYRVVGARGTQQEALAARLERVMREQMAASLEAALNEAFAGDEAVYVLRLMKVTTLLTGIHDSTDAGVARRWAEHLAGAVVHSISKDDGDGANLIRFDDQADYVAHFVVALLQGSAWERWYYGAYAPLRALSAPAALREVLLDNRQHVPAILGKLHERGQLDALLAALDEQTRRLLWREDSAAGERAAPDELRPLFAGALQLADQAGLWARGGARPDGETLFEVYASGTNCAVDWRDRRALAFSLFDIMRFLSQRGYLRAPHDDEEFLLKLNAALAGLDWLDAEWLRAQLLRLLKEARGSDLPTRPAAQPTPRQRDLLDTLAALVREEGWQLSGDATDASADALRLLAMLVKRAPQWADDAAARTLIEHLLTLGRLLRHAREELSSRLRSRDVEGALRLLAPGARAAGAGVACEFVARLGEQGIDLAENLAGQRRAGARGAEKIESACAGLSLLLRTILEMRLHRLAEESEFPSLIEEGDFSSRGEAAIEARPAGMTHFGALLLTLGLRLGGEASVSPEGLDGGLCVLANFKERATLDDLRACWTATGEARHALFQTGLLRIAAGQRLLSADVMHLYQLELEGAGSVLIACDESAQVWPLGCSLKPHVEVAEIVAGWLDAWEEAAGVRPALIAFERDAGGDEALWKAHEQGRASLLAAWAALRHGRLGLPETDLTVFLAACLLLRTWARWLRQFSSSSVPYLLDNFIRRAGTLSDGREELLVELERAPLDIVIEMASYLDELERVPWLENRRVEFLLRGA
ncbi:MAG TPA: hypothetical protein VEY11_14605 [Pyrinomonadaceae bacterium]|nr:hypothetical protein [Pyrinomonadaceae bacterium]